MPELLAGRPLLSGVLVAAGLLILAGSTARRLPSLIPVGLVFLAGAALTLGAARHLSRDRRLAWIVGGSYLVRSALATALYVVSAAHLPVGASLQIGDGFWRLAPDAWHYHVVALNLRGEAARSGWLSLDTPLNLFCGTIAMIYAVFTPQPLLAILFGGWAATATALLAFVLVRQAGGSPTRCLTASAMIAFWPSFLVWTSQLLREGQFFLLLFLAYALMAAPLSRPREWPATSVGLLTLALTVVLLSMSRFYVGWILLASTIVAALVAVATPGAAGRRTIGACVVVLAPSVWLGTTQGLRLPVSPDAMLSLLTRPAPMLLPLGVLGSALAVALLVLRRGPAIPKRATLAVVLIVGLALGIWLATATAPLQSLLPRRFVVKPYQPGLGLRAAPGMWALPSFGYLEAFRRELAVRGGTLTDIAFAPVSTPYELVKLLPSATVVALFTPAPWRWMPMGATRAFRTLGGAEVVLIALLLPGIVVGCVRVLRGRSIVGYVMVTSAVLSLVSLGVVIPNEGTLFRYRLQGLLPLLVIAAAGGGFEMYPLVRRLRACATPPAPSAV